MFPSETWRKELCELTVGSSSPEQQCVPTPHHAVRCQPPPMLFCILGSGGRRVWTPPPHPSQDLNSGYLLQGFAFKGQSRPGTLGMLSCKCLALRVLTLLSFGPWRRLSEVIQVAFMFLKDLQRNAGHELTFSLRGSMVSFPSVWRVECKCCQWRITCTLQFSEIHLNLLSLYISYNDRHISFS